MYASERTPLASAQPGPPYVFMANPHRAYRKQIRQFQCCVCTTILTIFLSALLITILYSVDDDVVPTPTPGPGPVPTNSSLKTLMQLQFPLKDNIPPGWSGPVPDDNQLLTAVQKGKEANAKKMEIEKKMPLMLRDSPTYRYRQAQKTSKEATKLAEYGHVMEQVTKQFSSISGKSAGRGPKVAFNLLDNPACTKDSPDACPLSRYRSIDGTCNNLNHTWGVAMKPFRRMLPPDYADGVSMPRMSSDNSSLPSAREVSLTIHRPEYRDDPKFTVMLAVWGQFLDHDLTATALSQGQNGEPISCCSKTPETAHPECMPVRITPEDPKFKDSGTDCLDFVRSAPAPSCTLGPREQLNQASSFLDASVVYGNDEALAKKLRSFKHGKMLVSYGKDGKVLLPVSTDPNDGCNQEEENKKGRYCFMAGDPRSNENLHLTTMHLLFVRQHNHMAEWLASTNPDWNDEKLYQESRHIVAAQMQHITYNEFLPVVLGPHLMTGLQLQPQTSGYWNKYNKSTDATIANNFAASSFRFAHTLLPGLMKVAAQNADSYEAIELHRMLFNPYKLYAAGYLAKAIQGAMMTHLERADTYFTPELTQRLFEKDADNSTDIAGKKPVCGLDLVSLNIQRGRDHGMPTYPSWREHCGFKRPTSFEDLTGVVDAESQKKMASLYKSVEDVDLYTGSLSEIPIEGGLLGPTATCLLADQFKRLKDGDRYWYETSEGPQKFSLAQLNEIRKTTLAGIICDTSDGVEESQRFVMQSVSPSNARLPCSQIPRPDLRAWKPQYREWVNISLIAGSIKTQDDAMVWQGALPVALTLPAYIASSDIADNVPLRVSGGIQWFSSSLRVVDQNTIYVNGSFSAPDYYNSKVRWANGNFELKFQTDSDFNWQAVQGQLISSPVYFKVVKDMKVPLPEMETTSKKFVLESPSFKKFILEKEPTVSKEKFILQSAPSMSHQKFVLQQSPKEVKAPIFFEGQFSKDRTKFYWDGAAYVLLPPAMRVKKGAPTPASSTDVDTPEDDAGFDNDWVIIPKTNPAKPLSIPESQPDKAKDGVSIEDDLSKNSGTSGDEQEHMVAVAKENPVKADVPANANVPTKADGPAKKRTARAVPSAPSEKPKLGFILQAGSKDSSESKENNVIPDKPSTQSVIPDKPSTPSVIPDKPSTQSVIPDKPSTPSVIPDKPSTPSVIPDKPSSPSKVPPHPPLQKPSGWDFGGDPLSINPWFHGPFPVKIIDGCVTAGPSDSLFMGHSTVWSGKLPTPIAIPVTWASANVSTDSGSKIGIHWTPTLVAYGRVEGTYYLDSDANSTTAGHFSFQMLPVWGDSTINKVLVPGQKFYSKINIEARPDWQKFYATGPQEKDVAPADVVGEQNAPLTIKGDYNLDNTIFDWTGDSVINIP